MKRIFIGLLILVTINLKAQDMETPKDVVINLFVATDLRDWNVIENIFSSSVILDYSSMNGLPASELKPTKIIDNWKGILPGFESTHHQLGNFQSFEEEGSARVSCYGTASHYLENDVGSVWVVVGTYDFDLIKDSSERWKITSMKFNFKYQDGNKELPKIAIEKLNEPKK